MSWNFHRYYTNKTEGLISKLKLSDTESGALKALRKLIRARTRDVFEEAKKLIDEANAPEGNIRQKVASTHFRHLSPQAQEEVAQLIQGLSGQAREAFLRLKPRFWTQGSFQYDTLNIPYSTPPQEMDIDDGTYLPMELFDEKPVIGHSLLLLLVDTSLKSLVAENDGWSFEAKRTCARIRIPKKNTHIDVPMYAIPEDQFLKKELALESFTKMAFDSNDARADAWMLNRDEYELDSDSVNLALREGEQKWAKSDPKIVEDWFLESCRNNGWHLRKVCRYMKAWRDAQWKENGPSSISLMAATVNILNKHAHDSSDLGETMKLIAFHLPAEFSNGVGSPDHTDQKLLFPSVDEHGEWENEVMSKLEELNVFLAEADSAATKERALEALNKAFGKRVIDCDLIDMKRTGPAYKEDPSQALKPVPISKTMVSG
jgi:hypothetical protein